jgi:hypothetical protein
MAAYTWSVFIPGADLPQTLEIDYLLTEGEEIELDGRDWIVERIEIDDETESMQAYVVAPHEAV